MRQSHWIILLVILLILGFVWYKKAKARHACRPHS